MSKQDKELKKIQNSVKEAASSMNDSLDKLQDSMKPLIDLSDLESKINSLTKISSLIVEQGKEGKDDESDASSIFETMDTIVNMVNETPNDKELGKTIRHFIWEITGEEDSTKDEDQLDLFD